MDERTNINLAGIKTHLEVNKDLKIADLEKENGYLTIQLNKYKKQFAKLRPNTPKKLRGAEKQEAITAMGARIKRIKQSHQVEKERLLASMRKGRQKISLHASRENFITAQFISLLGKEKFLEIINRLDNPDRSSRIISQERREKFLASDKYTE